MGAVDLPDVLFGHFSRFFSLAENCEFRTYQAAQPAIDTILRLEQHLGRVITLGIETSARIQAIPGTELDAETAAFAPIFYDANAPLGHGTFFGIQGQSPKLHPLILQLPYCKRLILHSFCQSVNWPASKAQFANAE